MTFFQKLNTARALNNSLVCVGLDPDLERIPPHLKAEAQPLFSFGRQIIDTTADIVCAYKPQLAYYSAYGAEAQLAQTIRYIKENYPHIPVILDAKRGDIGSTAAMYAREAFERYQADAVTVNPYLGGDSLQPFLDYKERGVFILCRTSNPGSDELQKLQVDNKALYEKVAEQAASVWNTNNNIGLVVGATYPEDLATIRRIVGAMPLLVPGIGTQGGAIESVIKEGLCVDKKGLIINASRSVIYASQDKAFAEAARAAAESLGATINRLSADLGDASLQR